MNNKDKIVYSAIITFVALVTTNTVCAASDANANANANANQNMEQCYGIVKAGMNDCKTATASCAGSATKDRQPDAFLFLPKGLCDKITGGSLKSK